MIYITDELLCRYEAYLQAKQVDSTQTPALLEKLISCARGQVTEYSEQERRQNLFKTVIRDGYHYPAFEAKGLVTMIHRPDYINTTMHRKEYEAAISFNDELYYGGNPDVAVYHEKKVGGRKVCFTLMADSMHGYTVHKYDFCKPFDIDRFTGRRYPYVLLEATGANIFYYHVFTYSGAFDPDRSQKVECQTIEFFPPNEDEETEAFLLGLLSFLDDYGLTTSLSENYNLQ